MSNVNTYTSIHEISNDFKIENNFNTDSIHWTANPDSAHCSRTVKPPSTILIARRSLKRKKILKMSPDGGTVLNSQFWFQLTEFLKI